MKGMHAVLPNQRKYIIIPTVFAFAQAFSRHIHSWDASAGADAALMGMSLTFTCVPEVLVFSFGAHPADCWCEAPAAHGLGSLRVALGSLHLP